MSRLVLLFSLSLAVPSIAFAQDVPPDVVIVPELVDPTLDLERVGERLSAETGAAVHVSATLAPGATSIVVRIEGAERIVLVLVRTDGSRMERSASVPDDPGERAETVAILAVNMLHDEAAELLAMLAVAAPAAPPADPPQPIVEIAADPPPVVEVPPEDPPPAAPPRDPFLRLGLAGAITSVPHGRGAFEADFFAGLEIAWTPASYLALGVRDLGGGSTLQGNVWHADGSPFFELGVVISFLTIHADVGAHLQLLGTDRRGPAAVGVAPFLLGGLRFRVIREMSLGVETTLRVVASDSFLSGLYELPQAAAVWSGGLSILFHVS